MVDDRMIWANGWSLFWTRMMIVLEKRYYKLKKKDGRTSIVDRNFGEFRTLDNELDKVRVFKKFLRH